LIKKRIIFALLYQDGYFYLSRNFKLQKVGDLNWLINNFGFGVTSNHIDELICLLVKKQPTSNDKKQFFDDINELRKKIFIPITLGGGIRDFKDVSDYFNNGADKVLLNTSIFKENLTREISEIYGEQSISIMIDYQSDKSNEDKIFVNCGTKFQMNLSKFFSKMNQIQFGEIILNSIENDGTGNGLDLKIINKIPNNWKKKPILLMGGAGKPEHIAEGLKNDIVSGVITANLFNFLGTGLEDSRKKSIKQKINLANFSSKIII
jgi:imidazole glycerol-phosphate synthase subunit HisF